MLAVAIASECCSYDGEIYRFLLSRLLEEEVTKWSGEFAFSGCKSVVKIAPAFLAAAQAHGVSHALLAVDNDGGSMRRPEHDVTHIPVPFKIDDTDTCRECWLNQAIPEPWRAERTTCVVVPVQVLETWLLSIRDAIPNPEAQFHRPTLKNRFFGKPMPSLATRIELAKAQLSRTDAFAILRQRDSFRRFEARVDIWRANRPPSTSGAG